MDEDSAIKFLNAFLDEIQDNEVNPYEALARVCAQQSQDLEECVGILYAVIFDFNIPFEYFTLSLSDAYKKAADALKYRVKVTDILRMLELRTKSPDKWEAEARRLTSQWFPDARGL
ncbi:MAG: hypothetical protein ACTSYX_02995 [Candidatus Thorarchaeota archaeon]